MVMLPHNRSCACQIGLSSTDTQYNGSSPFQIDGKARELVCGEKVFSTGCWGRSASTLDKMNMRNGNALYQEEVTL